MILSSNKDRENAETDQINDTFIVYPGSKLDSVALVRLSFDKNKQFRGQTFEDIPLLKDSFRRTRKSRAGPHRFGRKPVKNERPRGRTARAD